ncbi:MAG TPA: FHA domain-containing serine/threonine-protein kinase [Anaerolineales bacterium]|nr:FHA domain-containing serine/threonine-protein kinase [Anaerolineales bacterium]HLB50272.1 FHA domain-containing serine/threonine-protein kinase [Anaerolineales bacterium]
MLVGKTIKGRYRLYDQLGVGGSAAVFLARDIGTGRIAVVKIIHPHLVESKFITRFLREIKVLQQASSRNIVEIYDYGINHTQDDLPTAVSFIAMEYVEGLTISAIVERLGSLSETNTLALAKQIGQALAELHKLGVVHRDIKSQNIMVTADNVAKIIDFGVAKNLAEQTITGTDVFAGTLSFASPEQLKDSRNVDIRSDLYSLGVVLSECVTGKVPPRNRKGQHMFLDSRPDATATARSRTTGPARTTTELIHRLIALDPEERYPSPQGLIDDISRLVDPMLTLSLPWDTLGVRTGQGDTKHTTSQIIDRGCYLVSDRGDKISLTRREVVIGRSAPSDDTWVPDVDVRQLALDKAKTVSRFHCRIFIPEDGVYRLMDMGSFNGTWVNGRRLESKEAVALHDGDQIHLGGIAFKFVDPKREAVK